MSQEISLEEEMSIWEHLNELRRRLFIAFGAMVVTTVASFLVTDRLIAFLSTPIGGIQNLQSIEITENISVFMRVSLLAGVILAMPILVYEGLSFVMPGLKPGEKKWIYLAVPSLSLLFLAGVMFTFYVMLPAAIPFMTGFLGVRTEVRLSNYIGFVTNIMFWVGISFETPLLVFVLAKMKLVTARALAKQWRFAIVIIAIIAAVVTPTPDPINMGLLMLPLTILYLLSIILAALA